MRNPTFKWKTSVFILLLIYLPIYGTSSGQQSSQNTNADKNRVVNKNKLQLHIIDSLLIIQNEPRPEIEQGNLYNELALAYLATRQFNNVGHYAHKSIAIYKKYIEIVDERKFALANYLLGVHYSILSRPEKSLTYFNNALDLINNSPNSEKLKSIEHVINNGIVVMYRLQENNVQAIDICHRLINQSKTNPLVRITSTNYYHLSSCHLALGQQDSALYYAEIAIDMASRRGKSIKKASNQILKAEILIEQGELQKASNLLMESVPVAEKSGKNDIISDAYFTISKLAASKNDLADQIIYSRKSLDAAEKANIPQIIFSRGKKLADALYQRGSYQEAFNIYKRSTQLEFLFVNSTTKNETQLMELKARDEKVALAQQIQERQKDVISQKNVIIILITSLGLIGLLIVIGLRKGLTKIKQLNLVLKKQKSELEKHNETKSKFFTNRHYHVMFTIDVF